MMVTGIRTMRIQSPAPRSRPVGLRLTEGDVEKLRALAAEMGVGLSTFARLVLEEYVATHEPKRKGP